jgi:hypothetical protein
MEYNPEALNMWHYVAFSNSLVSGYHACNNQRSVHFSKPEFNPQTVMFSAVRSKAYTNPFWRLVNGPYLSSFSKRELCGKDVRGNDFAAPPGTSVQIIQVGPCSARGIVYAKVSCLQPFFIHWVPSAFWIGSLGYSFHFRTDSGPEFN